MSEQHKTTIAVHSAGNIPSTVVEWDGPLSPEQIAAFAQGATTELVQAAARYMQNGRYRPGVERRLEFKPGVDYYVCFPTVDFEAECADAEAAIARAMAA